MSQPLLQYAISTAEGPLRLQRVSMSDFNWRALTPLSELVASDDEEFVLKKRGNIVTVERRKSQE